MNPSTVRPSRYDFHLHTWWSYDAMSNPRTYFELARELSVTHFAITEHHNVDSMPEVTEIARAFPEITCIPAAELTVTTSIGPVDLLCYGLPVELSGAWGRLMEEYRAWQQEYGRSICRGLQSLGMDYTDAQRVELLNSYRPSKTSQRQGATHVKNPIQGEYFIRRGFIKSYEEYWPLLLRANEVAPQPPYPQVKHVTDVVRETGALIVIAHPLEYFEHDNVERMDQLRRECQLDGIECAHPSVPRELTPLYRNYCLKHNLVSTAGSDTHTDAGAKECFARHGGPNEWLDELLQRLPG